MQPLPNLVSPLVNRITGILVKPWIQYLQQFTQAPPNFVAVTVTASVFAYQAKEPGYVVITGGTVSAVHLIRGIININLTGQKIIPVSINDTVKVTYSVLPTVQFIPIYGANTNG